MKIKISKAEFEALPDVLKEHYKEKGGEYHLEVEGGDTEALKRAKDREKERANAAEEALKEANNKIAEFEKTSKKKKDDEAAENGDIEALRTSHEEAITALKAEHEEQLNSISGEMNNLLLSNAESEIIAALNPTEVAKPAIKNIIKSRLSIETIDGKAKVSVLDINGKPSIAKLSELQSELLENKELAPMLVAQTGSGGGATKPNSSGGGAATKDVDFTKDNDPSQLVAALADKVTS